MAGIEPATDGLRNRCSTAELHWRPEPAHTSKQMLQLPGDYIIPGDGEKQARAKGERQIPRAKFLTMDSEPEGPTRIYTDVKTTEARRDGGTQIKNPHSNIQHPEKFQGPRYKPQMGQDGGSISKSGSLGG